MQTHVYHTHHDPDHHISIVTAREPTDDGKRPDSVGTRLVPVCALGVHAIVQKGAEVLVRRRSEPLNLVKKTQLIHIQAPDDVTVMMTVTMVV